MLEGISFWAFSRLTRPAYWTFALVCLQRSDNAFVDGGFDNGFHCVSGNVLLLRNCETPFVPEQHRGFLYELVYLIHR